MLDDAIDVPRGSVCRIAYNTHTNDLGLRGLTLTIADRDVEGMPVLRIPYCTHPLKAACQEKRLPRTPIN